MQKFSSVHPVISKIDALGNNNYLVHETLKIGFIPFSFTYAVTVESNSFEKMVTIRATVMKFTKIEMIFKLYSYDQALTKIDETINFNTFLPVKSIMKRIFIKQHQQLFKNIEQAKE